MQFNRTGGCNLNERSGSKIPMHLKNGVCTFKMWVKSEKHDENKNPMIEELGTAHEGTAAETADEKDESAMEDARAVPAPLPSQSTVRVGSPLRCAHAIQSSVQGMRARTREQC